MPLHTPVTVKPVIPAVTPRSNTKSCSLQAFPLRMRKLQLILLRSSAYHRCMFDIYLVDGTGCCNSRPSAEHFHNIRPQNDWHLQYLLNDIRNYQVKVGNKAYDLFILSMNIMEIFP